MANTALEYMFKETMDATDRFGGASAWDSYIEWKEAEYKALIKGKTCLDCGNCTKCDIQGHETVGWCHEDGEFVDDSELVSDLGCETFVLR